MSKKQSEPPQKIVDMSIGMFQGPPAWTQNLSQDCQATDDDLAAQSAQGMMDYSMRSYFANHPIGSVRTKAENND